MVSTVPSGSVSYTTNGSAAKANEFSMRPMLERIYIGRRFKNDTERLEKLFELYTKMAAVPGKATKARKAATT